MNILLWIALAGVIVFLMMLYFSRRDQRTAQSNIVPAAAPSPVKKPSTVSAQAELATPVVSDVTAPSERVIAKPVIATANASENADSVKAAAETAAPTQATHSHPIDQTAEGAQTITPKAEPVGPGFEAEAPAKDVKKAVKAAVAVPAEPEAPSAIPVILKAPRRSKPDNLTLITGIGKALQEKLFKSGIYHFDQLASLTALQTGWVNQQIGFAGRVERENWIAQAQKLSAQAALPVAEKPKAAVKTPVKAKAKPKASGTATKATPAARKKPAVKS